MDKKIILIYVSHRNLKENPNLNDACKVLDEEKNRLNADELHEELEIKLIDYQYWRNISNPNKSPFQSRNTNKKKALHTHAHFTLVDGDMSPEIRKWYFRTIKWVRNSILMPIFWNTANSASRENCKKFEEKHKNKIDYIIEYNSLDELRKEAYKKMKELRSRCISKIDRRRKVPTILSVIVKKIIRLVIILLIAVLIWKKSGSIHLLLFPDKKPVVPEIELIDSSRLSFNDRIAYAESLVAQKQYTPALDTLMILKEICKIEWADEIKKIDSLKIIVSDNLRPVPPVISQRTSYIKNGCMVLSNNPDIVSYVRGKLIDESSLSLSFPTNGKTEWQVNIKEDTLNTIGVFSGVTVYKSTVALTANIEQEGKYKGDKKYEGTARSYESKEKAFYDALQNALEGITQQIIETIAQ